MNKIVLWTGIFVFVLAAVCFFLSGSTSGPTLEQATPTVPFLYGTNQFYWILLGIAGLVVAVTGLILKNKI